MNCMDYVEKMNIVILEMIYFVILRKRFWILKNNILLKILLMIKNYIC